VNDFKPVLLFTSRSSIAHFYVKKPLKVIATRAKTHPPFTNALFGR